VAERMFAAPVGCSLSGSGRPGSLAAGFSGGREAHRPSGLGGRSAAWTSSLVVAASMQGPSPCSIRSSSRCRRARRSRRRFPGAGRVDQHQPGAVDGEQLVGTWTIRRRASSRSPAGRIAQVAEVPGCWRTPRRTWHQVATRPKPPPRQGFPIRLAMGNSLLTGTPTQSWV